MGGENHRRKIVSVETISTSYPPLIDPASYYILLLTDGTKIQIDAGANPNPPKTANTVLATHWHWDHLYGLVGAPPSKVYISKNSFQLVNGQLALSRMQNVIKAVIGEHAWEPVKEAAEAFASRYDEIRDALQSKHEVIFLEESEDPLPLGFKVLTCPGHSDDHLCYLKDTHIFVGDNVVYPGAVSLTHLLKYRETIAKILAEPNWKTLYPGHGKPIGRQETLKWFLRTYKSKEKRMCRLSLLLGKGVKLIEALNHIYGKLDGILYYVAARSLLGYIRALEDVGLVEVDKSVSPWKIKLKD
ncbi:MAG: MBL fold metallo-hydrolase [Desulfurococcales archaeon]|nr:MBL fold metallo-hydrolase [Desulfurococcales archaeon]